MSGTDPHRRGGPAAPSASLRVASRAKSREASGKRFVLIASQFHGPIARALVRGATETLRRHGAAPRQITLLWVPGSFELPVVAARIARSRPRPDAIIALGVLVRGQTPQYGVLAQAAAEGLSQVSVTTGVPVTFGLIVAKTLSQARARRSRETARRVSQGRRLDGQSWSGGSAGGPRGSEAVRAAQRAPMRSRSKSREYALQMLYQVDIRHTDHHQVLEEFWRGFETPDEVRAFANQLVRGTLERLAEIDPLITSFADNWALKRMAVIDRNILRLGVFELLHQEVPPKVCINEAIELAKRFGDAESGKFINGILDAIHKKHLHAGQDG
jgi:N utilization substance protein B